MPISAASSPPLHNLNHQNKTHVTTGPRVSELLASKVQHRLDANLLRMVGLFGLRGTVEFPSNIFALLDYLGTPFLGRLPPQKFSPYFYRASDIPSQYSSEQGLHRAVIAGEMKMAKFWVL